MFILGPEILRCVFFDDAMTYLCTIALMECKWRTS